jgi:hypothetical protein
MTGNHAPRLSNGLTASGFVFILSLTATACSETTLSLAERGVDRAQATNDSLAGNLKRAPCAITLGSYYRTLSASEREALDLLCGGVRRGLVTVSATEGAAK